MHFDLHTHTHYSDGVLAPERLLDMAAEHGISHLAITDHDTVAAHRHLRTSNHSGSPVVIIPGIEVSSKWSNMGIHVVGLGIDIDASAIKSLEAFQTEVRHARLERIAKRLAARKLGMLAAQDIILGTKKIAMEGQIGRPHIAQYLVNQGIVANNAAAFRKYLGAGKVGDVACMWPDIEQAIKWITDAGGVAVLAHPSKYRMTRSKHLRLINDFVEYGGQAIEVCVGNQPHGLADDLANTCQAKGLYASVGSDFHNPGYAWVTLGRYPRLPTQCKPVWSLLGF